MSNVPVLLDVNQLLGANLGHHCAVLTPMFSLCCYRMFSCTVSLRGDGSDGKVAMLVSSVSDLKHTELHQH
jgi:hypothetical protein